MVLDTSAIIAILLNEARADALSTAVAAASTRLVSAATVLEASLVLLGRFGETGEIHLDSYLRTINATVVPVDDEQLALARDAARQYGRGRHVAALNYGDCFSYALSAASGEPLLFVGDDFSQTDITAAV